MIICRCTILDQHTVLNPFLEKYLFIKIPKKKFKKTAFVEFDRFPLKTHQRQEQPRPEDGCT